MFYGGNAIQPLVTTVIPTHNRAHFLERSIRSVLNQTYRNIELIVVDDCSTDDTESLIGTIADDRLRYIKLETKAGAPAARNVGVQEARGSYIAFQDSDDEWLPEKLELQMGLLHSASPAVGLVYSKFNKLKNGQLSCFPDDIFLPQGKILASLLKGNLVGTPTMVVRCECFSTLGLFDEKLKRFQDWEFVIRAAASYEFCAIDQPLVTVYENADSITARESGCEALRYIYKKHEKLFSDEPATARSHARTIAFGLVMQGDLVSGREYLEKSFNYRYSLFNRVARLMLDIVPNRMIRTLFSIAAILRGRLAKSTSP